MGGCEIDRLGFDVGGGAPGYESDAGAKTAVQVLHDVYKFRLDAPKAIRVEFVRGRPRGGDDAGRWGGGGGGCVGRDDIQLI